MESDKHASHKNVLVAKVKFESYKFHKFGHMLDSKGADTSGSISAG
jgi:hypothetical protein